MAEQSPLPPPPSQAATWVEEHPKRDTRGRRIAGADRRAEIIAGYAASGLTQKAYANREGVNYHTLVSWLGQSRRPDGGRHAGVTAPGGESEAPPRFAQLTWPPSLPASSRLEVVLPDGITLRGDDPAAMLILLQGLAPRRPC